VPQPPRKPAKALQQYAKRTGERANHSNDAFDLLNEGRLLNLLRKPINGSAEIFDECWKCLIGELIDQLYGCIRKLAKRSGEFYEPLNERRLRS
jgi:hypothetical protein